MISLDGNSLTIEDVFSISKENEKVKISEDARSRILESRKSLEKIISGKNVVYGVNTGFGSLLNVAVSKDKIIELQKNLIRSHASGVGEPFSEEHVRAMMTVRANTLSKGFSAVRVELVEMITEFLNRQIHPVVPRYGSVGASGDLAPLAHIALAMMGEGEVIYKGKKRTSAELLAELGMKAYEFTEKEGVAFINGTSTITGILSLELKRSFDFLKNSVVSSAMSFEGLRGTIKAFEEWAIGTRPHRGQVMIAENLRKILGDSKIVERSSAEKVQDAYSLRCIPQVYGAVLDTLNYAKSVLTTELNSATDNPLINGDDYVSAGNFHGEPVALVSDFVAIALTDLGNMIERRIARMVDHDLSGLPPFLIEDPGYNSGYMIPQYTAAALCNRNKVLCYPSTADSIPTSANQEDHVSMGANSVIKLIEVVGNLRELISIEFLLASQSLEFSSEEPSSVIRRVYRTIREKVPALTQDRPPYKDIARISRMIDANELLDAYDPHLIY